MRTPRLFGQPFTARTNGEIQAIFRDIDANGDFFHDDPSA
jgi:hypothetical protein